MLARRLTSPLNWVLDNLLPPVLRDSRWFMMPLFRLLFGEKARDFARFKEEAPFLTRAQFRDWYRRLADAHIRRETDLSPAALEQVLAAVAGASALDVGSGRGFLAARLAERMAGPVVGIDLFVPAGPGRERVIQSYEDIM